MLFLLFLQSIISAGVLALRRPAHVANYLLSGWFIINGLNFAGLLLPGGLVSCIRIGYLPFLYLNGPLLYLYFHSQMRPGFHFRWLHLIHALPFGLMCSYRLVFIPHSVNPAIFYGAKMSPAYWIVYSSVCLSVFVYLYFIYRLLFLRQSAPSHCITSSPKRRKINGVFVLCLLITTSYLLGYAVPLLSGLYLNTHNGLFWFNNFNLSLLGFALMIFGLQRPIDYANAPANEQEGNKYLRSGLNKQQLCAMSHTILQYLSNQKPYLNPDYCLECMVRDLNIPRQHLSQTMNDELGKNFYGLINELRVMEFKKYLEDPKMSHITFLALAYEAGFNSKTSFYRIFKDITGETPGEYRTKMLRTPSLS